jgi:hypothetical protein
MKTIPCLVLVSLCLAGHARADAPTGIHRNRAAFSNGVILLATQQFYVAERCFEQVTRSDPSSYHAWLNLGYARLMQYCDKLDTERLKDLAIGQVVCTAFYRRARSLQPSVRGIDRKLWFAAVGALNQALKLKRDSALARLNLGLAYLVHPDERDTERASEFLGEAIKEIAADRSLTAQERIPFHINLGVALMEGSNRKDGLKQFARARDLLATIKNEDRERTPIGLALRYNEALVLADGAATDKNQAVRLFEAYLRDCDPRSAWWTCAFDRYAELCKELKREAPSRKKLMNTNLSRFRTTLSLTLNDGKATIALGEQTQDVLDRLGKHTTLKVMGESLKRYRFEEFAIEVLATDRVIAIFLTSKQSPPVILRPRLSGAGKEVKVSVGMSRKRLLAQVPAARSAEGGDLLVEDADYLYRYYCPLSLAMRFDSDYPGGNITEIVIVQVD